jgi:hypothetical protein
MLRCSPQFAPSWASDVPAQNSTAQSSGICVFIANPSFQKRACEQHLLCVTIPSVDRPVEGFADNSIIGELDHSGYFFA